MSLHGSTGMVQRSMRWDGATAWTTVTVQLDRRGVPRRRSARKMTDPLVVRAAERYSEGLPVADVASEFGVHARTLAREFRRAGIVTRPRRGWGR